jgi:CDP-diacylglycerol--serine O-phosphatidyltransferase
MALGLRPRKDLPLTRLLPNMITLLSLCAGLTSMRYAVHEQWHEAALAIVLAGIFDMLDGRVARMLNIASKFGAELDSLADAISFGVAPGFVMYEWMLKDDHSLGWIAVLVYAVCTTLRLARFNTMLEDETAPKWAKNYFTGIPAPGGAGLAILPLIFVLQFGTSAALPTPITSLWLILIGGLMVSRMPTLSLKGLRVKAAWVAPMFAVVVLMLAALINDPWLTLTVVGITYVVSIPLGLYRYSLQKKREAQKS